MWVWVRISSLAIYICVCVAGMFHFVGHMHYQLLIGKTPQELLGILDIETSDSYAGRKWRFHDAEQGQARLRSAPGTSQKNGTSWTKPSGTFGSFVPAFFQANSGWNQCGLEDHGGIIENGDNTKSMEQLHHWHVWHHWKRWFSVWISAVWGWNCWFCRSILWAWRGWGYWWLYTTP